MYIYIYRVRLTRTNAELPPVDALMRCLYTCPLSFSPPPPPKKGRQK